MGCTCWRQNICVTHWGLTVAFVSGCALYQAPTRICASSASILLRSASALAQAVRSAASTLRTFCASVRALSTSRSSLQRALPHTESVHMGT